MAKRKISYVELEQLVRKGNNVSQISQKLGVTKGAVSKALKKLDVAISKDLALRSAPEMVDKKLDAMAQLTRINQLINNELNHIQKSITDASKDERKQLQDQQLKHVSEIRKQLSLLVSIAQALYNAEEIARFQQIVLEEIGNASPETRHKILQRLNEQRFTISTLHLR
jgi:DNA-binding transcriptional ArsR family regulator